MRATPLKLLPWVLTLSMALPRGGQAQNSEKQAAAEALFDDARKLAKSGDYAGACPMFAESQRLDPAVGTLLYLADCYEQLGKTASAWAAFRDAASAAKNAGQADRAKKAEQRAADLEPRLARLVISLAAGAAVPGLVVKSNDTVLMPVLYGKGIPVDAGGHHVSDEAPGYKPWRQEINVTGQTSVVVPPLAQESKPPPATSVSAPVASASSGPPPVKETPPTTRPDGTYQTFGLVAGGVGVVAVGVGAFFGLRAMGTYEDRQKNCRNNVCSPEGLALDKDARSQATLSNVFFAVGAAGLAAGAVLYLGAPQRQSALAPVIAPGFAGLSLGGAL